MENHSLRWSLKEKKAGKGSKEKREDTIIENFKRRIMNQKEDRNVLRNKQILFLVNKEEEKMIKEKMATTGITHLGAYLRKMAIDGYVIQMDLEDVKEVVRLLRISSNNLNQYAKKANETGSIYKEDLQELKDNQEELWKLMKVILSKLADL